MFVSWLLITILLKKICFSKKKYYLCTHITSILFHSMKTVFAKIVAFVMTLCLLALPLTSEAVPHACQKQSYVTHCKATKACHKEDVPDCCKKKNGTAPKHTCCQAVPMASYARLEKTETVSTYQLVKKQVLPTIVSPWALAFVDFPTERALVSSYNTTTLLLVRNIPILFQQFLC